MMHAHKATHRNLALSIGLVAALVAGGSGILGAANQTGSTPVISRISPLPAAPAKDPQVLTIAGQDFQPHLSLTMTTPDGSFVQFREEVIQSQRESSFQVAVTLAAAGKYTFVVLNADGGKSNPFTADVKAETKIPEPAILQVTPEDITKGQEPQNLAVTGKNFGPGLRAILTDPQGAEVVEVIVRDVMPTSFKMAVKLETSGPYNLVVSNATGAVSNIVTITVK